MAELRHHRMKHYCREIMDEEAVTQIEDRKTITTLNLITMIYFWTCGAPFGIEGAVGAGGAIPVLICIVFVSLFWCLPQALMSLELSLMFNVNGSNILWVERSFGQFIGFLNAYCYLLSNSITMSLQIILFVEYLPGDYSSLSSFILRIFFFGLLILFNIRGLEWISRVSLVLLVLSYSPFILEAVVLAINKKPVYHMDMLMDYPSSKEIRWGVLLSTCIWAFGGFDTIGTVAGEVKGGKNTFLWAVMGSFPMIVINYMIPIIICYGVDPDWRNWDSGYFGEIVYDRFPSWLCLWMALSVGVANIAQGCSNLAASSWIAQTMSTKETGSQYLPSFFSYKLWHTVPLPAMIFVGIVSILLSLLPFDILVQIFLLIRLVNLILEHTSLFWLRYTQPDIPRPFVIPGGTLITFLLCIPSVIVASISIYTAPFNVLLISGSIVLGIMILSPLKNYFLPVQKD